MEPSARPITVEPGPDCPAPVARPTARHRWDDLTFLHWDYEPAVVQALLPPGLTVETFAGRAWVALVPFRMTVTLPGAPAPPWLGRFPETNVRTYVRGPDGGTGVWFLSLDATRAAAVVAARSWFRLPYHWSAMRVSASVGPSGQARWSYRCRRRAPGPAAASRVVVEVGPRWGADELGPLDHWLTARWSLWSAGAGGLRTIRAEHGPWPLHRARLVDLDDGLVAAAGLPAPTDEPRLHWSPGVAVQIGRQVAVAHLAAP